MIYKESDWHILLDGKKILIAGYGREGRSSQTFLSKLLPTANIDVADGNSNIQSAAPHYDLILKSPGIPMSVFADVCPLHKVSSQSDLFLQVYHNQTIGITGTKGKSTTTELINHMLVNGLPLSPRQSDQQFTNVIKAGNMGIPLFDIIPQMSESTLVVAELSCHQLENIHCAPHISVLLNLFQEHLDHYPSYRHYQMAKLNIAIKQYKNDHCFYCADNPDLTALISELRKQITSQISPYTATLEPTTIPYSPSLQGLHNRSNAIVAKMVAQYMGVDDDVIEQSIKTFKGLRHRMEYIGCYHNIRFYNDSISTIPAATMAAVDAIKDVDTLIVGGYDRGIDYQPLALYLLQSQINNIAFVGRAGRRILNEYQTLIPPEVEHRNILINNDFETIVAWCYQHTKAGGACLLSPAAASYDAFKNFEERGSLFEQFVKQYRNQ